MFDVYFKFCMAGFFQPPVERPLTNTISFQHPLHNSGAPRPSIPGEGDLQIELLDYVKCMFWFVSYQSIELQKVICFFNILQVILLPKRFHAGQTSLLTVGGLHKYHCEVKKCHM